MARKIPDGEKRGPRDRQLAFYLSVSERARVLKLSHELGYSSFSEFAAAVMVQAVSSPLLGMMLNKKNTKKGNNDPRKE